MNPIPLLQQGIFFQNLDEAALTTIVQAATTQTHPEGHFLFHESDPATTFFVIIQGRVRLSQVTEDGRQVILGFIAPGEGVGIIAAIPQAIYPLAAQTAEPCTLLCWDSNTLQWLMERYPIIAYHTLKMLAGRFVELQNRYRELATERVERRIARTVLRLADQTGRKQERGVLIDMPLSRQELAEMTGTTLYTVSRTLSQWEQRGIVETGREWIRVRQPDMLVTIAEDLLTTASKTPPDMPPCLR